MWGMVNSAFQSFSGCESVCACLMETCMKYKDLLGVALTGCDIPGFGTHGIIQSMGVDIF